MHFTKDMRIEDFKGRLRGRFSRWLKDQAKPLDQRFWEKVDIKTADQCWLYTGECSESGYGQFVLTSVPKRVRFQAHRVAWSLVNGPVPEGLLICHHCDNPPCCNPSHLFAGTHKDNMQDCGRKKRHFSADGEKSVRAKLTDKAVIELRKSYTGARGQAKQLAQKHGISIHTLRGIVYGKRWKHLLH